MSAEGHAASHAGHHGAHDHDSGGQSHGSFRSYMTGFVLSVILTAIPFWLVMGNVLGSSTLTAFAIMALAAAVSLSPGIYFSMNTSTATMNKLAGPETVAAAPCKTTDDPEHHCEKLAEVAVGNLGVTDAQGRTFSPDSMAASLALPPERSTGIVPTVFMKFFTAQPLTPLPVIASKSVARAGFRPRSRAPAAASSPTCGAIRASRPPAARRWHRRPCNRCWPGWTAERNPYG